MNYLIPFIILILVVVFIHEYGHYYFAKRYGVGVTDFSIGFGKEIFGWNDKSGTRWKICWIPLGGYVKFFGDRNVFSQTEQQEIIEKYSEEDRKKLFILKPLYQRSLIVAAGPLANFLLAILIFTFIFMFAGKDMTPAVIEEVQADSPAFVSGLKANDQIISVNGKKINSILEVSTFISTSSSKEIQVKVLRNDEIKSFSVVPKVISTKDSLGNNINKRMIGVRLSAPNKNFNYEKLPPSKAIFFSLKEVWFVTSTTLQYIKNIFVGSADPDQLGGPIRIAKVTGQVAEHGVLPFLSIMAYISISLGLINLFPIPMLDGGHLAFYAVEKILGRPLKQKTQEGFFRIGLFLLFSLMFFATFNDLKDIGIF
jgi:regulator of sigma E protease